MPTAADIFTLQRGGYRQHDIGEFSLRGPVLLVDHHRFRPPPRFTQLVEIPVVMERVPRPVHRADIRVAQMLAVKLVLLAGMQQHIRQSRHRDHAADRIFPGR